MKITDLNENLNEGPISGPAGFAQRAKAKLQKNAPFARNTQKRGAAKDAVFAKAKEIKNGLKVWMDEAGKDVIGLKTFLDWLNSNHSEYAEGTLAAAKEIHTNLFQGKETEPEQGEMELGQGSGEPKQQEQKPKRSPEEEEQIKKAYGPGGTVEKDAEAESKANNSEDDDDKQDLTASKGDDEEPKVDTSASIYESRLRAMLEAVPQPDTNQRLASSADGEISDDDLEDNEIDTLIVRGLQKHKELVGTGAIKAKQKAEPEAGEEQVAGQTSDEKKAARQQAKGEKQAGKAAKAGKPQAASASGKISDEDFTALAEKVQDLLRGRVRKIINKASIDEGEKKKMLSELDSMIVDVIDELRLQ